MTITSSAPVAQPTAQPSASDAKSAHRMNRLSLRRPRPEELATIASWSREESAAAVFINTSRGELTAEGLAQALAAGLNLRVFVDSTDTPVGLATWTSKGNPRSYDVAMMIADPTLWRVGLGGEAAVRITDYLFMACDAHRVSMQTAAYNPYTSPALQRGGFTLEARLRDFFYVDGRFHDAFIWSMLRHEHAALIAAAEGTPLAYAPEVSEADARRAQAVAERLLTDPRVSRSWDVATDAGTNG